MDLGFVSGLTLQTRGPGVGTMCPRRGVSTSTMAASGRRGVDRARPAAELSRREALGLLASSSTLLLWGKEASAADEEGFTTSETGLQFKKIKAGGGKRMPKLGELVGIRVLGSYKGRVFDDLFKNEESLYIRLGNEQVIKAVEEILQKMVRGDRYKMIVPPELGFGKAGRRASAGKPSIPAGATLEYEVELSEFPGAEDELLELSEDN